MKFFTDYPLGSNFLYYVGSDRYAYKVVEHMAIGVLKLQHAHMIKYIKYSFGHWREARAVAPGRAWQLVNKSHRGHGIYDFRGSQTVGTYLDPGF